MDVLDIFIKGSKFTGDIHEMHQKSISLQNRNSFYTEEYVFGETPRRISKTASLPQAPGYTTASVLYYY